MEITRGKMIAIAVVGLLAQVAVSFAAAYLFDKYKANQLASKSASQPVPKVTVTPAPTESTVSTTQPTV